MMKIFNHVEEFFSSFFIAMMTIVIIVQVIFRYFISYSLAWPEELGRYLFIATVFIGSSYVEQHNKHLAITVLRTNGPVWCRKWLSVFSSFITFIFSGLLAVWGIQMVVFMYDTQQLAPAIEIPMYIVYAVIPLGMIGMGIRAFKNVITQYMQRNEERI